MCAVKLISITPDAEKTIAYCARVSNPLTQETNKNIENLLKYCMKNNHWSIFEMANMTVEIETSRAISAQILRHRSFSFQEFCIHGDSKITMIQPNGFPTSTTIKKLYETQHYKDQKNRLLRVYDTNTKTFTTSNFKEVFKTGIKPCFCITLENNKSIICTKEHKFLSENEEFDSIENIIGLSLNNNTASFNKNAGMIATNGDINNVIPVHHLCHIKHHGCDVDVLKYVHSKHKGNTLVPRWSRVTKVEYVGMHETYDIEVDHNSHNYVANKIITHNSQRYSPVSSFQIYEARQQDSHNRQNSLDTLPDETKLWFKDAQAEVWETSHKLYNEALSKGIAKECARFLLPMNTTTKLYMNGTIRSWIHYLQIRTGNGTQKEHMDIANEIKHLFCEQLPIIGSLLD